MTGQASEPRLPEPPHGSPVWRDALAVLTQWAPTESAQAELRSTYLEALRDDTAVFKSGPPVHLTASCIVFDEPGERVLLTMHGKARTWLQFGGHLEVDDPSLYAAAQREVAEESGIDGIAIDPQVLELHRHTLGSRFGRCAEHLDVRFVGWAPAGAEPTCSTESLDVRWWPIDSLPAEVVSELGLLIERGARRGRDRAPGASMGSANTI